ncbi:MAG: helix-turn-helix transcriptional regulator [Planctomycetota bacterium]
MPEAKLSHVVPDREAGRVWLHDARHVANPMREAHRHREWEMCLVERGTGEYIVADQRTHLRSGSMIWLLPSQVHILLRRSTDFRMWIMVARPSMVRSLARGPRRQWQGWETSPPSVPEVRQVSLTSIRRLHPVLRRLLTGPKDDRAGHDAGLRWALVDAWSAFRAGSPTAAVGVLSPAVVKAARLIARRPELDADALADAVAVSRSHLSRLIKAELGQSITELRNRERVRRFATAVRRGRKYTAAAYEAGFGSYAQCFRVVRQLTGSSPREWVGP